MSESTKETPEIVLNGDRRPIRTNETVGSLLEALDLHPRTVAVELNGEILPRGRYADSGLAPGDRVEIVHFVQGG